jgi:hypothetical protein
VRALAAATRNTALALQVTTGHTVAPAGINRRIAEDIVETVLAIEPKGRRLTQDESTALLQAYGIDVWPSRRS